MYQTEEDKPCDDIGIDNDIELLRNLLGEMPFPVWLFDKELNLARSSGNRNWLGLAGLEQEEPPVDCEPEILDFISPTISKCFTKRANLDLQGWVEISRIGRCYVLFHFLYLSPDFVACIPLEMTEYKQLENLLFNSEVKVRTLVETIPDGVWVHDHNLIITYCNERLCRMLGLTRTELTGRLIFDLVAPGYEHDLQSVIKAVGHDKAGQCEIELLTGSSERLAVMVNSAGISGTNGGPVDYLAVIKNISHQKETSEALIESERRYQAVVEDQQELICRFDTRGSLTFANQAYCRYVNLPASEVLGTFFARKVPEEDLPAITQMINRVANREAPGTIEHRFETEDGEQRWLQWQARLITGSDDNPRLEVQAVGRDITERKVYYQEVLKYQEQLRSLVAELAQAEDRERRRIAVDLHSHLGQTLEELDGQLQKVFAGRTVAADSPVAMKVTELVELARERCRTYSFQLSPQIQHEMGFTSAVEWLVRDFTDRYGVVIEFTDDNVQKPVTSDVRLLLFQALRDALAELAEDCHTREIKITLEAVEGDLKLQLMGICDADKDRFLGAERLRLFSIRERLGIIGGRVEIRENDNGTVILRFQVPMSSGISMKHATTLRSLEEYGPGVPIQQIEVLLVDSQVMMREGMRSLVMRDESLKIIGETGDGREAVDMAIQLQPDLILIDESTSGLGACETIQRVKTVLPETRVIAMTLKRDQRGISSMLRAGAEGFIFKDSAHLDLKDAIRITCDGSRHLSPEATEVVLREYLELKEQAGADKHTVLTPREIEVLEMLSSGMSTKEIARKLGLSIKTIETHRRRISTKLGLKSIAELTRYAISEGLINLSGAN